MKIDNGKYVIVLKELPDRCSACPASDDDAYCQILGKENEMMSGRLAGCPIIKVPSSAVKEGSWQLKMDLLNNKVNSFNIDMRSNGSSVRVVPNPEVTNTFILYMEDPFACNPDLSDAFYTYLENFFKGEKVQYNNTKKVFWFEGTGVKF